MALLTSVCFQLFIFRVGSQCPVQSTSLITQVKGSLRLSNGFVLTNRSTLFLSVQEMKSLREYLKMGMSAKYKYGR